MRHKHIAVLPLSRKSKPLVKYVSLKEALTKGYLLIEELSDSGTVATVKAMNLSDNSILILESEQIIGAKQNRMSNASILIPGHAKIELPVSCTEKGRWSYNSDYFSEAQYMPHTSLRKMHKDDLANKAKAERFNYVSDQSKIWNSISKLSVEKCIDSSTESLEEIISHEKNRLKELVRHFSPIPDQVGFAVYINQLLVGIEYISDPAVYHELQEKLLSCYFIMADNNETKLNIGNDIELQELFDRRWDVLESHMISAHPSKGLGKDLRWKDEESSISALAFDEVIHFSAIS